MSQPCVLDGQNWVQLNTKNLFGLQTLIENFFIMRRFLISYYRNEYRFARVKQSHSYFLLGYFLLNLSLAGMPHAWLSCSFHNVPLDGFMAYLWNFWASITPTPVPSVYDHFPQNSRTIIQQPKQYSVWKKYKKVLFSLAMLLILLNHFILTLEVYQASFYAISGIFLSQKLTLATWKYHW